jgi:hypothetical protein
MIPAPRASGAKFNGMPFRNGHGAHPPRPSISYSSSNPRDSTGVQYDSAMTIQVAFGFGHFGPHRPGHYHGLQTTIVLDRSLDITNTIRRPGGSHEAVEPVRRPPQ